ncbi:speckle-type POZ protein-like [Oppia nitens]|uniref:speckle-type POZ protein-like n=1 Tax=Oppia nitens TaxID=1686743 RepID=UPI0023DB0E21|nr:speckle-type POZ protein-like [Oppia nitens]
MMASVNKKMRTTDVVVVVVDNDLYPEMHHLMNPEVSDVQFVINGQTIPAIKALMSTKSVVFRSMFSGKWVESGGKPIEIRDTTPEAFKVMLGFIYTERLILNNDKDIDHIRDVLKLADRYQLKRLIQSLGQPLIPLLSMDKLEVLGQLAFTYQLDDLIAKLKIFIDENFQQLIQKPESELNSINTAVNNLLFTLSMLVLVI